MRKDAKKHILEETASWQINTVSTKRNETAYQIAEGRKAAKRARQEVARARELESQKQFTTQTKSRKQAELAEYVTSTQAAKNEVKKVYKNLNKTV